jgi:hypothetical protein
VQDHASFQYDFATVDRGETEVLASSFHDPQCSCSDSLATEVQLFRHQAAAPHTAVGTSWRHE